MAKRKRESDLFDVLRRSGLRKKVAKALSESAGRAKRGKPPTGVARTVENLRTAASELENRVGGSRRTAGKKAAQTRRRNAAKRSASAKKAAKTRARTGR